MIAKLIRHTSLRDLLLPIGAALITIGLEHLAEREHATRARLAGLQAEIALCKGELAGMPDHVEPPADPLDESNTEPVLDAFSPFMPAAAARELDEPDPQRRWKWAAAAVGVVAMVATVKAGPALLARFLPEPEGWPSAGDDVPGATPWEPAADGYPAPVDVDPLHRADARMADFGRFLSPDGGEHVSCHGPDGGCEYEHEPVNTESGPPPGWVQAPDGSWWPPVDRDRDASVDVCGWPNCDYEPIADTEIGRATQLAVHRNSCVYRPAGAHVPGE